MVAWLAVIAGTQSVISAITSFAGTKVEAHLPVSLYNPISNSTDKSFHVSNMPPGYLYGVLCFASLVLALALWLAITSIRLEHERHERAEHRLFALAHMIRQKFPSSPIALTFGARAQITGLTTKKQIQEF